MAASLERDVGSRWQAEASRQKARSPVEWNLEGVAREFPLAAILPQLPSAIPDRAIEYYAWLFRQGGFSNLELTFEQFLTVIAAVNPAAFRF